MVKGENMKNDGNPSTDTDHNRSAQSAVADSRSRRDFLGGVGALGLAAMSGLIEAPKADATQLQDSSSEATKASSIGKIKVLRDEKYEIPGGSEQIVQYTMTDEAGRVVRHSYNYSHTKQSGTYTIASTFRVEHFASGQPLTGKPASTKTLQVSVYGVEGEVIGNRRRDTITTTIMGDDGNTKRETQVVPVRLDLSEFDGLDTAALVSRMRNVHLGNDTLSK
jgi:hypothetical protein